MQVEKARELGLCFGVRRAVDMVRDAALRHGNLQTLGPIAHNKVLLQELAALGVETVDSVEQLRSPAVVISAHGVSPSVSRQLLARGLTVVDTTCPNVARAQHIVARLADEGFTIVIFGDSTHTEVRGLLGWAGEKGMSALGVPGLPELTRPGHRRKLAVISQTTQRLEEFTEFARELCSAVMEGTDELRVVNTLCDATVRRQAAAAELARRVDIMLVIGGRHSANTRRLAETCAAVVETHHVETAEEMDEGWFAGKQRAGLTAGASTPDSIVEEIASRLARR
ncbi:MAG: 4-hydroxy-3-methylbut-2-enyl diphosphate reductase [Dehalococcoidia bacterium]|jgi:4-hydroxy-3-methylbut-2-enyl diphosphate reductase|nr:4-hydroxy-3-methylbut-2-enyl diphosphate reductase [Dehalococcoidia bacterium]